MTESINIIASNIEQLREQLRSMPDDELLKFGEAGKWLCDPKINHGGRRVKSS